MEHQPHIAEAPAIFNMAVASLQRLDGLLKDYKLVSYFLDPRTNREFTDAVKRIKIKYEIVKQFQINAEPLLSDRQQREVEKEMESVPNLTEMVWQKGSYSTAPGKWVEVPIKKADRILDEALMLMERLLQSQNYFMPPKKDTSLSVVN